MVELLHFDHIDERLLTLKAAHSKTCRWFLDTDEYKTWTSAENVHSHRGFLWIKGKPGAGKSILMKFLHSDMEKAAKSTADTLVISFFFNARGEHLERSTIGLYRSLLWQLFQKADDLCAVLDELGSNAQRIIHRKGWQLETLKETLAKAITNLGSRTLYLYIDALDECDDDEVADMISFFEEIGERALDANVGLHICFSSRHYPSISVRWGAEIILEDEEEHEADITRYIKSMLKLGGKSKSADGLRTKILQKSAGVFLWVAIVIPMLNKACARGRVDDFQKCLDGIPPGLDDLFELILTRDSEDMDELRLCIQWILFTRRPLTLAEYFFCIRSPQSPETTKCWVSGDISDEDMRQFVNSSSKGLAQATKTRSKDKMATVQFIHESVRDFFLVNQGNRKLWPDLDTQFTGHSQELLKVRCLAEVNGCIDSDTLTSHMQRVNPDSTSSESSDSDTSDSDSSRSLSPVRVDISSRKNGKSLPVSISKVSDLRRSISSQSPFLPYAVQYVLHHADVADGCGIVQGIFTEDFPFPDWILLSDLFEPLNQRHKLKTTFIDVLGEKGLTRLIRYELSRVSQWKGRLLYAAEHGAEVFTRMLLDTGKVGPDPRTKRGKRTALSYAAQNGHEGIVNLLLDTGKVDVNSKVKGTIHDGCTPLVLAAGRGHENIVKLLLKSKNIDADSKATSDYDSGRSALSFAAERGHEGVVKLLLEAGKIDADSRATGSRRDGQSPLSFAASNGHERIVKLLLESGKVDTESRGEYGQTPLLFAAMNGHEAVVKLLLEFGKVKADSKNQGGQTPLSLAVINGHEGVVKLLLEIGKADPDLKDEGGRTPLSFAALGDYKAIVELQLRSGKVGAALKVNKDRTLPAASFRRQAIVKLLLETGKVNVDSRNKYGRTPLSFAASEGDESMFRLLLETGKVKADSEAIFGRTPLSFAASGCHEAIVKLLLGTDNVRTDSKDDNGLSPLSFAAMNGGETVAKLLLATVRVDVDLKATGKQHEGKTPLALAAENGHQTMVELLLNAEGVDVNSKDKQGQTPLSLAASSGRESVVKKLIETRQAVTKLLPGIEEVDIDLKDNYGQTPLMHAVSNCSIAIVKRLLATGQVDVNSKATGDRYQGKTALAIAAEKGYRSVVEELLNTGRVDVESKDEGGRSPLSLAVINGRQAVVKLLLSTGKANVESADKYGNTPLLHAQKRGYKSIIKLLERGI